MKKLVSEALYPYKTENYLSMSQRDVISDWHVDCSGSTVFYQVLSGVKKLKLVVPSAQNKRLFGEH